VTRQWLRAGLGFLAVTQVVVGGWALFLPTRFFALEVVGMGMAYNEHLMRDYGAMTLAGAVVLGAATIHTAQWLARTALGLAIALPTGLLVLTVRQPRK
jgi:hypothetical protein